MHKSNNYQIEIFLYVEQMRMQNSGKGKIAIQKKNKLMDAIAEHLFNLI